jgi:hypothetical protein
LASFFMALTSALLIATASASATQVAAAPCNDDGWCWESPLPQGNNYRAAWAAADDDVWIVGERTVVHWDGKQAVRVAAPAVDLQAVFGTAADDVWAWSNGNEEAPQLVLIHWDGKLWSPAPWPVHEHGFPSLGKIAGVWGRRGDVRFMAGNRGEIVHWNGTRFTLEPTLNPPLARVWGAANGMAFGLAPGNETVKAVYFGRGTRIAQELFSGAIFSDNQLHAVAADDVTIVSSSSLHGMGTA